MTTRSPRPRCQSKRSRTSDAHVAGQVAAGRTGRPPVDAPTRHPGQDPPNSSSLVSVGHRPAGQRRVGQAGGERGGGGRGPPAPGHRASGSRTRCHLRSVSRRSRRRPRRPSVPSGRRSAVGRARRRVDARSPTAGPAGEPGRRRRWRRARPGCPGRAGSRPAGPRPSDRPHWSSAERRSLRMQVWGRAARLRGPGHGRSRAVPVGTTRLTRPMASASSAPTSRPVRMRSRARPWPTSRGSRTVPPSISGTPKRRQNTPNAASCGGHPEIAPDGQLEAAGHGVALDGGDDRLGELQAGRTHGPRTVLGDPMAGSVSQGLQIGAGAEGPAGPGQHGHARRRRRRRRR